MKKLKKYLALILALLMVAALVSACAKTEAPAADEGEAAPAEKEEEAGEEAPAGDEPVTIEALIWLPDVPNIPTDMADAFMEKYPNITVETQLMSDSETSALQPRMAANNMPDFHTITAGSFANEVADGGYLLDVGDTQAWANMLDSMQQQWISPEKEIKYGISGGLCTTLIYYNKGMFDEAGITEVPTNYQEFLAACQKLKDAGFAPMVFNGGDPNSLANGQFSYGCTNYITKGDNAVMQGIVDGTYEIPESDLAKCLKRVVEVAELGYANDGYLSTDYMGSITMFVNGDAAMLFNGTWVAGNIFTDDLAFDVGCFLPPWNDEGQTLVPCLSTETGHTCGATGDAAKEAAAKKYLDFWYGEGFPIYQNPRQCVPGQKMDTIQGDIVLADQIVELMDAAASYPVAQPLYFGYMPSVLNGCQTLMQEMIAGTMTADEAAKSALETISQG